MKAFDVLIEALAILKQQGRLVSATIAGEGPDAAKLTAQAEQLGIADLVRLVGYRPAREAFAMGRMMVIPSRAESLPYVILEAAAAGVSDHPDARGGRRHSGDPGPQKAAHSAPTIWPPRINGDPAPPWTIRRAGAIAQLAYLGADEG